MNHSDKETKLRRILKEIGMSQRELAEKTKLAEYQISNLCTGKRSSLLLDTALVIAQVLDRTVEDIFIED